MGKTPKPLKIVTIGWTSPELDALEAQGHLVIRFVPGAWIECDDPRTFNPMDELLTADLILGPTCWLMNEQHHKYLDLAISEARRRRYPPKEKGS